MSKVLQELERKFKFHTERKNYLVTDANERTNFSSSLIRNYGKELQEITDRLWELEQQIRVVKEVTEELKDNYAPPATG